MYIDDTFTAIENSTFEVEVIDSHLPFLDVMVRQNGDGLISTSKKTYIQTSIYSLPSYQP